MKIDAKAARAHDHAFLRNTFIFQLHRPDYRLLVLTVSLGFNDENDFEVLFHLCIPAT